LELWVVLRKSTRNIFSLMVASPRHSQLPNLKHLHSLLLADLNSFLFWNISDMFWKRLLFDSILKCFKKSWNTLHSFWYLRCASFLAHVSPFHDSLKNQVLPPDTVDFDGSSLACRPFKTWQFFTVCSILGRVPLKPPNRVGFEQRQQQSKRVTSWATTATLGTSPVCEALQLFIIYLFIYLFTYLLNVYIYMHIYICIYIYTCIYLFIFIFIDQYL